MKRKTRVHRADSGDIHVQPNTTWGISVKDISVGGLQIEQKLEGAKKGSLIDGKVGLNQSSIRLYSDVICEVIDNTDAQGARLKFIEHVTPKHPFADF